MAVATAVLVLLTVVAELPRWRWLTHARRRPAVRRTRMTAGG
ncbi:hypothetical protein ACGF5C_26035 [Micromonospora sp. NPDC047620]